VFGSVLAPAENKIVEEIVHGVGGKVNSIIVVAAFAKLWRRKLKPKATFESA
jgi:hypothetical protein